jgi:DNA-binding NarL/FixJ family response regulator
VREAAELATRLRPAVPLARANDDFALSNWATFVAETGSGTTGLDAELTELLRHAAEANDQVSTGILALASASLRIAEARYTTAARWLDEAELQFERHDVFGSLCIVRARQAEVAVARGLNDEAAAARARCYETLRGNLPLPAQAYDVARAEGWTRYATGDAPGAQRMFLDAARTAAPMPFMGAQLAYEAMRAGAPASVVLRELEATAAHCDAPLTIACAAHVDARARRDPQAVLQASAELEAIGYVGYALEAAAHAAELFSDVGREDSARRATARARALLERTEERSSPFVAGLEVAQVGLTTRERQLLALARAGLTNAEIADRLVLSIRTVESHIYRAMQKLGLDDRRQL